MSYLRSLRISDSTGLLALSKASSSSSSRMVILDLRRSIKRLESDKKKRPLLIGDDLAENFSQIYESRKPIYSESDLRIEVEDQSPYEVATMIAEQLPSILIDPETQAARHTTEL